MDFLNAGGALMRHANMHIGIAQQLRGAHFMSHDLWTAGICWVAAASVSLAFWPRPGNADAPHGTRSLAMGMP